MYKNYKLLLLFMFIMTFVVVRQSLFAESNKFANVNSTKPFEPNIGYLEVKSINQEGVEYHIESGRNIKIKLRQDNQVIANGVGLQIIEPGMYNLQLTYNETAYIDSIIIPIDTLVEILVKVLSFESMLIDGNLSYEIKYIESPRRIIKGTIIDRDTKKVIPKAEISNYGYIQKKSSNIDGEFLVKTFILDNAFELTITHDDYETYYFQREGSLKRVENINIQLNKKLIDKSSEVKIVKIEYRISDGGLDYGRKRKTQLSVYENSVIDSTVAYELKKTPFKVIQIYSEDSVAIEFNDQGLYLRGEDWNQRKTFSPLIITTDEKCLVTTSECSGTIYCFRIVKK